MEKIKNVYCDIISIGDELLIGQTINTNASWLGMRCNQEGVRIRRIKTIPDSKADILTEFEDSLGHSDIVLVTGGLGPTKDDITKKTICEFFDDHLIIDEATLNRVQNFFAKRKLPMLEVNTAQALVPSQCRVIPNHQGTAPGMWFEKNGKVLISMPGVPFEMKGLMDQYVFEWIKAKFQMPVIIHQTLMTIGVGESYIADQISPIEDQMIESGISLAYLPSPGVVKLRLSSYDQANGAEQIEGFASKIKSILGDIMYSVEEKSIYQYVHQQLLKEGSTLSIAESCTGGKLQSHFTDIPGCSQYFRGGIVPYDAHLKVDMLGIAPDLLKKNDVVSEAVAVAMAEKCKEKFQSTYALATTGYAGPESQNVEIPVGTICIAVAGPNGTTVKTLQLGNNRERNIETTCLQVTNLLRLNILNK
jgi:nicotinamide-nucleotide amidase